MRLDRIYTRGGDAGQTSLGDGARVAKHDPRVAAYGTLDEANSAIGVALLHIRNPEIAATLRAVQNDLFDLGADLCRPEAPAGERSALRATAGQVARLEREIDRFNADLEPLRSFILPGGSAASAYIHLARAIVRRAERDITALAAHEPVNPEVIKYANRLSDLLFVLARHENDVGRSDVLWAPGLNQ